MKHWVIYFVKSDSYTSVINDIHKSSIHSTLLDGGYLSIYLSLYRSIYLPISISISIHLSLSIYIYIYMLYTLYIYIYIYYLKLIFRFISNQRFDQSFCHASLMTSLNSSISVGTYFRSSLWNYLSTYLSIYHR